MQCIVEENYEAMSQVAARLIAESITSRPQTALVFATGNTPLQCYRELALLRQKGKLDVSQIKPFQLDEYLGIGADDPRSLYGWSKQAFLEPLDISTERLVRLRGDLTDSEAACQLYEEALSRVGGFDIAVLGLGPNGHLGFNEPPSPSDAPTRQVNLTRASLVSNALYWGEQNVPHQALTCGMSHLLGSQHVILLVSGAHKQDILRKTINGPVTPEVPSSYLQQHPNVTVIADQAAWPHTK